MSPDALDPLSLLCLKPENAVIPKPRSSWDCSVLAFFLWNYLGVAHGKWLPLWLKNSKPSWTYVYVVSFECAGLTLSQTKNLVSAQAWNSYAISSEDGNGSWQVTHWEGVTIALLVTLCNGIHSPKMPDAWVAPGHLAQNNSEGLQACLEIVKEAEAYLR